MRFIIAAILCVVFVVGCGPTTTNKTIFEWEKIEGQEDVQDTADLRFEFSSAKQLPPAAMGKAPILMSNGQMLREGSSLGTFALEADPTHKPQLLDQSIFPTSMVIFPVTITNNTDHVVRLTTAVIRVFDPSGSDFSPVTSEDIQLEWYSMFPVWQSYDPASYAVFLTKVKTAKLITPGTELLPKLPYKGYLVFKPTSLEVPGVWKLTMYDIPVEVDPAGKVTKTVMVEYRSELVKYNCVYMTKGLGSPTVLQSKTKVIE